jgi:hypothetical protein
MVSSNQVIHPVLKWAQRKEFVFITIECEQLEKHEISLKDNVLAFEGEDKEKTYGFSHKLFAEIDEEKSKWNTKGRHIICTLYKKDTDASFWTRITEEKTKNHKIQADFNKWCDSDEEDEAQNLEQEGGQQFGGGPPGAGGMGGMEGMMGGMGGGGMPGMGGMGGMPGMGGMGGMGGMEQMMGGMGGMPGMGGPPGAGGAGGMDMAQLQ